MRSSLALLPGLLLLLAATGLAADAAGDALGRGLPAIQSMTGCYLVDYSYVETESLKPGYVRDAPRLRRQPGQVREGVDLPPRRSRPGAFGCSASCSPPTSPAR